MNLKNEVYLMEHEYTDWEIYAHARAMEIVKHVAWPWTDREKRLWYIGVLAGAIAQTALEAASLDELQIWHKELFKESD
jgi:hypothetical protein